MKVNDIATWLMDFGNKVDSCFNCFIGLIIAFYLFLYMLKWLFNFCYIYKAESAIDKFFFYSIKVVPWKALRRWLSDVLNIKPKIIILLPNSSQKNYKHLAYQLNGINRFFTKNRDCYENSTIFFVNNKNEQTIKKDIDMLKNILHTNRRYIIIATMSDIFNTLSEQFANDFRDEYKRSLIRIVGTLSSRTSTYGLYKNIKNIIRLSPPDFDEANKASLNIFSKLISNYCPANDCIYNRDNKIVIISSNAYGDAVKKSLNLKIDEIKKELDKNTGFYVDGKALESSFESYNYKYDGNDLIPDKTYTKKENIIELKDLLKNEKTVFYFFLIGYEPNISNILTLLNKLLKDSKCNECRYNILISATVSVKEWQDSIKKSINNLEYIKKIEEIDYLKIKYPEFKALKEYDDKDIICKFYTLTNGKKELKFKDITKNQEIKEIIESDDINYINGFMIMSLEYAQKLINKWDESLPLLKEELYSNYTRGVRDKAGNIIGIKILNSGDSIDHFKVETLYKKH